MASNVPVRQFVVLLSILLFLCLVADSVQAEVSYLRPDRDLSSTSPWQVFGATRAWEALDDPVAETNIPTMSDYISATSSGQTTAVGLHPTRIAGMANLVIEAWVYSPSAAPFRFKVKEGNVEQTISTAGWSSFKVTGISTQQKMEELTFSFTPLSSAPVQIPAAFLKLSYTFQPRVYWGARIDGEVYGSIHDAPWDKPVWTAFENSTVKPVSIVHFGQEPPWKAAFTKTPLELTSLEGAIPMMSMGSEGATLNELEEGGAKEPSLRKWAKDVAQYQMPFFFRWDWEMNLISASNIPWAAEARANPAAFVRAWRNFRRIADQEGASNITWVWCPNVNFPGSTSLASLYPGNAYVDWICMDGYNHGTHTSQWTSWVPFKSVFGPTYNFLTDAKKFEGSQKPIMIGETASTESGGSKSEWITTALENDLPWNFPKIKAFVWFNWNITEAGTPWDWQIESSPAAIEAFASGISSPYYAGASFGNLPPLTRIQPLP